MFDSSHRRVQATRLARLPYRQAATLLETEGHLRSLDLRWDAMGSVKKHPSKLRLFNSFPFQVWDRLLASAAVKLNGGVTCDGW